MAQATYILVVVISAIVSSAETTDPCTNYVNLNDPERSTAYARGTTAICDSTITEQWYRSVSGAGTDMPTSAVPVGRCGTQYPIWAQDQKEITVCIAHIFGDCHHHFKIKVKNCVNYNVYYLSQTSGCPTAYCFGTQLQCPAGQSSVTGFTPGCEAVPTIPLSPTVTAGLEDGHAASTTIIHKSFKFDCNLGSTPANHTFLLFQVRWYIEDNEIVVFENVTYPELASTSLSESKWINKYRMGFNVKCTMRAKYNTSAIYGTVYDSAFFYAGFKVKETELTVREAEEKSIDIWLTVPIGYAGLVGNTPTNFVTIRVMEPEYQQKLCQNGVTGGGVAFKNIKCGVKFDYNNWNVTQQLSIAGERDSLYNSDDRMTYIRLQAESNIDDPGWSFATIPDIRVRVVDQDIQTLNKKCISSNDPHMTTFDRRSYENQRAGEFVMFKHTKYPIAFADDDCLAVVQIITEYPQGHEDVDSCAKVSLLRLTAAGLSEKELKKDMDIQTLKSSSGVQQYSKTIKVKVVKMLTDWKEYTSSTGKRGKFLKLMVADQTGCVKSIAYDDCHEKFLKEGACLLLRGYGFRQGVINITSQTKIYSCEPITVNHIEIEEPCVSPLKTVASSPDKSLISVQGKIVQVHAMYTKCPGYWWTVNRATCNCGVAVRNDDALFIANFCGEITTGTNNDNSVSSLPTNRYIEKVSCDDKYMTVVNDGSKYTITLPTGTVIVFSYGTVSTWGGSEYGIHYIYIKPSVEDIKSSSGLCGYFDGNSNNDFRLRDGTTAPNENNFAEDWRVPQEESLFASDLSLNPANVSLRQYCTCRVDASDALMINSSKINCELLTAMETCTSTKIGTDKAEAFFTRCGEGRSRRSIAERYSPYNSHGREKRSTESEDGIDKIELIYNPDYTNTPTEPVWSNGWDESKARAYCSEHIEQNNMFILCKDSIPNYDSDISRTLNDCVNDIKMSGNTQFLEASIESLKTTCLQEATRLENLTKSASSSGNASKSLLDDILDISCKNNCSGNGTCTGGICTCFTGYKGAYCNLQKSVPPTVSTKSNSGKCKTDRAPCKTYGITGDGFIYGSLKCKARHFQIFSDGRTELTGTSLSFSGTYINEISCYCTIPDSRRRRAASASTVIADGYYISVSNDGTTFSEEITFINYDSSCYECNVTAATCTELSSCNGTTTVSSTASTSAGHTTTVTASVTTKTAPYHSREDKEKRDKEDQSNVGTVIAVIIGVIALIMLGALVAIVLVKKKIWNPKSCIADSSADVKADKNGRTHFSSRPYEQLDQSRSSSTASLRSHTNAQFSSRSSSTVMLVRTTNESRPETPGSIALQFENSSYETNVPPSLFTPE